MKCNSLLIAGILLLSLCVSCDDDSDKEATTFKTQGFIKGTVNGETQDGSYQFDDDFNFTQYGFISAQFSLYEIDNEGNYQFSLFRTNYETNGSMNLNFVLEDETDTPDEAYATLVFEKETETKIYPFSMSVSIDDPNNTGFISDFSFNPATGRVQGKFTLSGDDNSTTKNATVTGEFDLIVKQRVN